MSSLWRYRSFEDGDFETAATIDGIALCMVRLADHLAVPGAGRMEAVALARLAETRAEQRELETAKELYEQSILKFEEIDPNDEDLRAVHSNHAVVLRALRGPVAERAPEATERSATHETVRAVEP